MLTQVSGNTGKPNSFVGIGELGPYISNNMFNGTAEGVQCLLYQIATENQPSSISGLSNIPLASFQWAASKLNPIFQAGAAACPRKYRTYYLL